MSNVKSTEANKKEMGALSKSYLVVYNGVQTVGWSYILVQALQFLLRNRSVVGLWEYCGNSVILFQNLAVLEVVHCIIGIVPSSALITFLQVASRVIHVWGILIPVEKVQTSPTLAVTIIAWALSEIIRYSFYFTNLLGKPSKAITWCRYTFFMGLYPAGVTGEVSNIFLALDTIKKRQLFSFLLPNPLNISFNFYYANIFILLSYLPLFPHLFNHMLHQRRKVLGAPLKIENAKKAK